MSRRSLGLNDAIYDYLVEYGVREIEVMRRLRERTDALPMAEMRSSLEQVNFLQLLLKATGARRVVEVGVFTGYATLGFALALPEDGIVHALDISHEWPSIGRAFWEEADVARRIDLRIAPASESLRALMDEGLVGLVDFVFIDADKTGYAAYYEAALELLHPGGLIAADNVLWSGRVIDPAADDADTVAIREFNAMLRDDTRIDLTMLPLGDGLTLARKR
ncbi:MAG: SAM-dependent methyltransferase [Alphaproteobacteria bacterium]|nr:MAG: SAM-dependent methyltransferase [Alphaproteobacteria bacterium]